MGARKNLWDFLRQLQQQIRARTRISLFLAAISASLLVGFTDWGQPLERTLTVARNTVRQHDASGDIVIVALDDHSLKVFDRWPWPRRYYAQIAENLVKMGAERVFFDLDLSSYSDPVEDRLFSEALARLPGRVTVASLFHFHPETGEKVDFFPIEPIRRNVKLANVNLKHLSDGTVWWLPYALKQEGRVYPSFSASLAKADGEVETFFRIDHAINPKSIPAISASDVIQGKVDPAEVAGKTMVIGAASVQLGDTFYAPGSGIISGVYLHVLGAETLAKGRPVEIPWQWPLLLSALVAGLCLMLKRERLCAITLALGLAVTALMPLVLEQWLIFTTIVPALTLFSLLGGTLGCKMAIHAYRARATVNPVSGLPNLVALRQEKFGEDRALVVAKILNFAEVTATLPQDEEQSVVRQIAQRLTLGQAHPNLYHGDEGIFAWFVEHNLVLDLGGQLVGLHALFRSPVIVSGSQLDLNIAFGVEAGSDRSLANRLGSALVAAEEAVAEGEIWKQHDPAKLKDAAWRLSLLSQLDAAIEGGDLWIAYQPKLELKSGRIVGAEALVRWTHPEKGPISPIEFIVAAEQNNRIEKLTAHVLDGAIAAAAALNRRGHDFEISVNISARLIANASLPHTVEAMLSKHRLAPDKLVLEITETAALATAVDHLSILEQLRSIGVHISIDDYGTGLSTLEYMRKIPANEIKIDRTFVQGMARNHSDRLMVNSTIQLAHSLGQRVVAEGVEEEEALDALVKMGCDTAQGFFIAKPMKLFSLFRFLRSQSREEAA